MIKDLLKEMDSPFDRETTVSAIQNEILNTLCTEFLDDCLADLNVHR